jgi:hypothetical protein
MSASLACPKCSSPWPTAPGELAMLTACPTCRHPASVTIFPALLRPAASAVLPENLLMEGEASCFYHPAKRAAVPCSACGRFLCALCDVKLGDRNLCPGCIEAGRTKGRLTELEPGRTLWDTSALLLALLPLLILPVTLITAPAALATAVVGWKKPSSVVSRGKWRLWLAVVLAGLQIAGWVTFFVLLGTGSLSNG